MNKSAKKFCEICQIKVDGDTNLLNNDCKLKLLDLLPQIDLHLTQNSVICDQCFTQITDTQELKQLRVKDEDNVNKLPQHSNFKETDASFKDDTTCVKEEPGIERIKEEFSCGLIKEEVCDSQILKDDHNEKATEMYHHCHDCGWCTDTKQKLIQHIYKQNGEKGYGRKNDVALLKKDYLEVDASVNFSSLPLLGDEKVAVTSTILEKEIKNKLGVSNEQIISNVLIRSASSTSVSSDNYDHFNDPTWQLSTSADSASSGDCKENVFNNIEPCSSITKPNYKKTCCAFCEAMIVSQHFSRHLRQYHKDKSMVKLLMDTQNVKERKNMISKIRNKGNLVLKMKTGQVIPKKIMKSLPDSDDYTVCAQCKGFFRSSYIVRHNKKCSVASTAENKNKANPKVESFILSLQENYQVYLKSEPMRKELIAKLRMDEVGKAALSDPIILEYGMRLLQTAKDIKKKIPAVRNKIRECARRFLKFKEIVPEEPQSFVTIMDNIEDVTSEKKSSSDGDEQSTHQAEVKKLVITKKSWTTEEIDLIKEHFACFLQTKSSYPNSKEMKNFLSKYLNNSRSIAQLRSKIQHLKRRNV